ncbi:MAG TPA: lysine--tRNA ligase [archaeon]|nr:lysine--tRNA ligase [archaeon]
MEELAARRVKRLQDLRKTGFDPFAEVKFRRSHMVAEVIAKFGKLADGEETDKDASMAGRLFSIRIMGGLVFADLRDGSGRIQLMVRKGEAGAEKVFEYFKNYLDEGDIVGVSGKIVKTRKGEVSINVNEIKMLAKALRPIPSEWYGVKDVEVRYRQRYLDLIMNSDVRELFTKISIMTNAMRQVLLDEKYVEVETPVLQPIYGGAFAKPFKTHHNFLKQDMFLRIAPELYLKKLTAGGLERVFEVAKCFRNESVDTTHNPEFSQIELYEAYADYERMMELTERMVEAAVVAVHGKTRFEYQGKTIDVKQPWKRMKMLDALREFGKLDLEGKTDVEIRKIGQKHGLEDDRTGKIIEDLFSELAQPHLVQPVFITHFPADISPLAKKFKGEKWAQRFEGYMGGMEICNAFSEMNDPAQQFVNFREEDELRKKSGIKDLEFMPMDRDYIRAMEYGMPPCGGLGVGLGRVFQVVLNKPSLKEVILFPALASKEDINTVVEMFPELTRKQK